MDRSSSSSAAPPPDEQLYRQHFLPADATRTRWAALITLVLLPFFALNDHKLFGWSRQLFLLGAVRVVTLALLVAVIFMLRRAVAPGPGIAPSPRTHDRAVGVMLAALVLSNHYVVSTRPPEYLGHGVPVLVALSVFYFVVPGPLAVRAAAAIGMSVSTFWFVPRSSAPPIGLVSMVVAHAFSHAIGIPIAARFEKLRREGFSAQIAEQRTRAELAQKASDLEAAKERAEALAKVKSEFLATMSHELRTPMNAVLGLSDVLVDTPLAPEQKDLVRTIHQSAGSLLVLINDILDLAKVEAGRMTVQNLPFDVREAVRSAVEIVQYQAAQKSLFIEVAVSPEVPAGLSGDAARVRQVLLNLLSNAVKFTEEGTVSVRASSRELSSGEHEITFTVQDTGIGISPVLIQRLFTPFEQGDSSGASPYGGTGLGLVISKRLVELMGGTIRAESALGRGSKFQFSIRGPAVVPPSIAPSVEIAPLLQGSSLQILLVEDNLINKRVSLAMLGRLGCHADVASNGREALSAGEQKGYDLILMDLRMPEMDGFEAARRILARSSAARRPHIVAMTASAFDDDRAASRAAGMEDFISKPVQIEALRAVLVKALAASRASASAGAAAATAQIDGASAAPPGAERPFEMAEPTGGVAFLSKGALENLRQLETPDSPGFFAEVCRQFVTDAKKRITSLQKAVAAGDPTTAEREAHSLKSMSAMVGASRMSRRCVELESSAHEGDLSRHAEGIAWLRAELERVARALEGEIGDGPHPAG